MLCIIKVKGVVRIPHVNDIQSHCNVTKVSVKAQFLLLEDNYLGGGCHNPEQGAERVEAEGIVNSGVFTLMTIAEGPMTTLCFSNYNKMPSNCEYV